LAKLMSEGLSAEEVEMVLQREQVRGADRVTLDRDLKALHQRRAECNSDELSGTSCSQCPGAEKSRALSSEQRRKWIAAISDDEAEAILHDWAFWARPNQLEPSGDWVNWLVMAGRGYGKTRIGAEQVRKMGQGIPDGEFSGSNNRRYTRRDGARRGRGLGNHGNLRQRRNAGLREVEAAAGLAQWRAVAPVLG